MFIKTKDNKIHKVIKLEKIVYMDIWYFEYQCEDGNFYEPQIIASGDTIEELGGK